MQYSIDINSDLFQLLRAVSMELGYTNIEDYVSDLIWKHLSSEIEAHHALYELYLEELWQRI